MERVDPQPVDFERIVLDSARSSDVVADLGRGHEGVGQTCVRWADQLKDVNVQRQRRAVIARRR